VGSLQRFRDIDYSSYDARWLFNIAREGAPRYNGMMRFESWRACRLQPSRVLVPKPMSAKSWHARRCLPQIDGLRQARIGSMYYRDEARSTNDSSSTCLLNTALVPARSDTAQGTRETFPRSFPIQTLLARSCWLGPTTTLSVQDMGCISSGESIRGTLPGSRCATGGESIGGEQYSHHLLIDQSSRSREANKRLRKIYLKAIKRNPEHEWSYILLADQLCAR
jgi:hypothetical protein